MRPFEGDRRVHPALRCRSHERGRGRRAARGPRGAAWLRRHGARRRRARAAAGHDSLSLPARCLPTPLAPWGADIRRGPEARPGRPGARRRRAHGRGAARSSGALARPGRGRPARPPIQVARSVYLAERFDPGAATQVVVELGKEAGARAREEIGEAGEGETARELEQRARRAARGAERDVIVESLDLLAGWYRDVLAPRPARRMQRSMQTGSWSSVRTRAGSVSTRPAVPSRPSPRHAAASTECLRAPRARGAVCRPATGAGTNDRARGVR